MSDCVRYPAPGCIVEYLEGNAVQIALITEEAGGRLRLLLPNRRETRLAMARLLPWSGPVGSAEMGREDAVRRLEAHKKKREELAAAVPVMDAWDLAQGEVDAAPASWFAELFVSAPDVDTVAAYGRALLACKSHFRFQPPDFQVFPAEQVEKRLNEEQGRQEREALIAGGAAFFRLLWDVACKKRSLPQPPQPGQPGREFAECPSAEVGARLKEMLLARMADPESQEHDTLWRMLSKGLPEVPHLPLQLLEAWGQIPPHYNFWLDRADYTPGDAWWLPCQGEVQRLLAQIQAAEAAPAEAPEDRAGGGLPEPADLPLCALPFVSIDSASTRDVDDAFYVEASEGAAQSLTLALACPALAWPFNGPLDKLVQHRGTSIYLPEGDCHMLPETLGTDAFSLLAGHCRPALCARVSVDAEGGLGACEVFTARVSLAANLTYTDSQAVLDAQAQKSPLPENAAAAHAQVLEAGLHLARRRQEARIAAGAVIMERPEPHTLLSGQGAETVVELGLDAPTPDAQMLVAEMMILASAAVAQWAREREIPMLHRTQDVALPKEYAGVWTSPPDMTRIMRSLAPSMLEVQARPHAALGLPRYTPVTSPLRRYPDLVNEAQVVHFLHTGRPLWDQAGLTDFLAGLSPALDAAGQVQRYRPRYWKLLYFRQKGDKVWWPGVITEENDNFVSVSLPDQGMFVRGRRRLFDERACPGMAVSVRLGKVHPLYNEIQIQEAVGEDSQV